MPSELPKLPGEWNDKIFGSSPIDFNSLALEAFHYQYSHNHIYANYVDAVGIKAHQVSSAAAIPFLPIRFFKSHKVMSGEFEAETFFESSGTTKTVNSRHYIKSLGLYRQSFESGFQMFYGPPQEWCILALLPAYLERQHSSLVVMADQLIRDSKHPKSGFYLYDHEKLRQTLEALEATGQKTLLLGVSFALLDFAEANEMRLQHTTIMETGGMKGRREEWTRQELHEFLQKKLGTASIHAEYGMTELLSQAYSNGDGIFNVPPWMKIVLREEDDPFAIHQEGNGVINVIDLANIHSCSFIATDDAGRLHPDSSFEVLGRVDQSDLRGCSLMAV